MCPPPTHTLYFRYDLDRCLHAEIPETDEEAHTIRGSHGLKCMLLPEIQARAPIMALRQEDTRH